MKPPIHRGARGIAVVVALATVLLGSSAWAAADAWVTTKAKIALLTTEGIHSNDVNVDTIDGTVTLHGEVETAAERGKAEDVVQHVDGVRHVRNLLQVVPTAARKIVDRNDAEIQKDVERALATDPQLKDGGVTVQSVHAGAVLLAGDVKTLTQHLHAIEVTSEVPGVKRVESEIKSPDRIADAEIYSEKAPQNDARMHDEHGATGAVRDAWITSDVKLRLLADARTPALDVNVDTNNGKVTLFGIVDSGEAKAAAEEDARKVADVKGVDNALQVVAAEKREAIDAKDDEVEDRVKQQIAEADQLKGSSISVDVKNGVARLEGTVPTHEDRLLAAVKARKAIGVRAVKDDLTVKP
jgi:hyperosmotically inducible protein